jgi:hypothetical protein
LHEVNRSGNIFLPETGDLFLPSNVPIESAFTPFDIHDAKLLLAKMRLESCEGAARQYDRVHREAGERQAFWAENFAAMYRDRIGVRPERRELLRTELKAIVEGKHTPVPVAKLIREINQDHVTNGDGPRLSSFEESDAGFCELSV